MEKVILKTMVAFVKEQIENAQLEGTGRVLGKIGNYGNFLDQPLSLGMFVPCDLEGNVFEIIPFHEHKKGSIFEFMQHKLFEEAKDRVLFEGFEYHKQNVVSIMHKHGWGIIERDLCRLKVEEYANNRYNLELTPTAQKQLKL